MAARPLQPSEYEIQREVEALKDLRRRSTTPGALTIDPDLPNQSPPASPTSQYRSPKSLINAAGVAQTSSSVGTQRGSSSSDHGNGTEGARSSDPPNNPADDPFHLFWVPAGLHPEIAPQEFRAFLKEHARSPNTDGSSSDRSSTPSSLSTSSSVLGRKKSMLSRQYKPKEDDDDVEEENIVPLKRNRSLMYPTNPGPQLTISDLQRLEELAEEASQSDDTSRLRNVLRRSLSLNLSPTAIDLMDDMPDMGDEADVPIIVPPPGQILRRTARTKIRKQSVQGDGGGTRFTSRRGAGKTPPTSASTITEPRTSSEVSSSDHGDTETPPAIRRYAISDEGPVTTRPDSYSEEASIIDSYSYIEDDDVPYNQPSHIGSSPMTQEPMSLVIEETPPPPVEIVPVHPPIEHQPPAAAPAPVIHQPQAQRLAIPTSTEPSQTIRTPSPAEPSHERPPHNQPPFLNQPPAAQQKKDKKGGLFKWGGDKGSKKNGKERESRDRTGDKEKDSGFSFGSLFGKKKQDSEYQSSLTGGTSGRETAQALLGASKSSKNYVPPSSPGLAPGLGGNPYARYPIHVERAIYRLSHIKLANPRRPLYEQVLISNLMFWYLGIINKAQTPTTPTSPSANGTGNKSAEDAEREANEKEQRERAERERAEKERVERERQEREQREKEAEMKKRESGKRGSLTKTPAGGPMAGGRRAEMPVKGPQYEMQHRVMEQEYGGYNGPQQRSPNPQMPPMNGGPNQYQRGPQPMPYNNSQPPPKPMPSQSRGPTEPYQPGHSEGQSRGLPPGAMPPADQVSWGPQNAQGPVLSQPHPQQRHHSPDSRRSQSPPSHGPPPMNMRKLNTSQESLGERLPPGAQQRGPGRSLSATASSALPHMNGGGLRKGNSAHAVSPYENRRPHTSEGKPQSPEEEDVPLAVWQQQRRK